MVGARKNPAETGWTCDDGEHRPAIGTGAVAGGARSAACGTLQDARFELGARHDEPGAATTAHPRTDAPTAQVIAHLATRTEGDHRTILTLIASDWEAKAARR
jgi:hypothetical protein